MHNAVAVTSPSKKYASVHPLAASNQSHSWVVGKPPVVEFGRVPLNLTAAVAQYKGVVHRRQRVHAALLLGRRCDSHGVAHLYRTASAVHVDTVGGENYTVVVAGADDAGNLA